MVDHAISKPCSTAVNLLSNRVNGDGFCTYSSRQSRRSKIFYQEKEISMSNFIPALKYDVLTKYYDVVVEYTTSEKLFKSDIVAHLKPNKGDKLLDLGCGTGTLATMIKGAYPGIEITGLDADEKALHIAKQKSNDQNLTINFERANATKLPFPSCSFDSVVSSLFFHHLLPEQKKKVLLEVQRVLKPEGVFYLADWGVPKNLKEKIGYFLVQLLDGFKTTNDNKRGLIPVFCSEAGFNIKIVNRYSSPLGDITILMGKKADQWGQTRLIGLTGIKRKN